MNLDDLSLVFEKALLRASNLFGYELKPHLFHVPNSINILDLTIRDLMSRRPDIFFVQVGAHDGSTGDPIAYYVKKFHWKGILVEPQPVVFKRLKENYRDEPQLIFENSALSPTNSTLELHCFVGAGADDHASMLASTRKHYLTLNGDGHKGTLQTIQVPALSFDALLSKHHVERIDVLQIDTEGFDFEIIKMIDFHRFKPEIIHFENNFLNRRQKSECSKLLTDQGYAIAHLGIDTIAYLQPPVEGFDQRMKSSKVAPV